MTGEASRETFDVERLIGLRRVWDVALSPCDSWMAVAVQRPDEDNGAKYVSDLWRVPLDGSGPHQLTRGASNDNAPAFRRDGALLFLSNRLTGEGADDDGDSDRSQIWLLPAEGGEPRPLTDEPLGISAFAVAREAPVIACLASVLPGIEHDAQRESHKDRAKHGPSALRYTRTPVRRWDKWVKAAAPHLVTYDDAGGDRRDWTPDADRELRESELAISRDGRYVAVVTHRVSEVDRCPDKAVLLVDRQTEQSRELGWEAQLELTSPRFSPDGVRLAVVAERRHVDRSWRYSLRLLDITSGDSRTLAGDWDVWPSVQDWTPDGGALVATAEEGGQRPVYRVDVDSGDVQRLTSPAAGGSHARVQLTTDGRRYVGMRARILHPPEPFVADISGDSEPTLLGPLSGWTSADGAALASIEELEVVSTDGRPVHCRLVRPASWAPGDGGLPTVMWIHGGPMSAWGDGWHWRWNPLVAVAQGYAIALPNPRGSTGFGQDFIDGIWGNNWGAQCFEDVMAVADALEGRPEVDAGRMAAMGGSFGGYMTNWLGGNTDRFRCLITHASLFSMSSFYSVTDMPPFWALAMGGHPWDDPESFDRYSPSRFLRNWVSPTLVIHGERDYRVPIDQALALFEGLQHHGVPSELLVFPDENHWILKPRNIRAWYDAVLEYLGRYLSD